MSEFKFQVGDRIKRNIWGKGEFLDIKYIGNEKFFAVNNKGYEEEWYKNNIGEIEWVYYYKKESRPVGLEIGDSFCFVGVDDIDYPKYKVLKFDDEGLIADTKGSIIAVVKYNGRDVL